MLKKLLSLFSLFLLKLVFGTSNVGIYIEQDINYKCNFNSWFEDDMVKERSLFYFYKHESEKMREKWLYMRTQCNDSFFSWMNFEKTSVWAQGLLQICVSPKAYEKSISLIWQVILIGYELQVEDFLRRHLR